ncbi:MAG: Unknown protein [uncultured Aureispira sp.]|uniref:Uncharacterized protein n=1 Tax=uncultured Aureispira sp. TaxID=1331704 RepID=A0A6S6UDW7_9BACT|nr:MAG: Unknown protein [uncultured Aureispira sp.]
MIKDANMIILYELKISIVEIVLLLLCKEKSKRKKGNKTSVKVGNHSPSL